MQARLVVVESPKAEEWAGKAAQIAKEGSINLHAKSMNPDRLKKIAETSAVANKVF